MGAGDPVKLQEGKAVAERGGPREMGEAVQ